ncbi:MAG: XdhC family protein [Candidatus Neomarinimicrobiota bacterium]|jgi:xanthine dehydrogenase accessory factor|nr:XdhC family protein [Candidatus Neomarinimicrobiota bacterium]MDD3965745.1 XdhC family protein [Candidatus Neomarinimicrobiota bacterium]MDX9780185.1 XdhC family protein [bacterium]
MKSIYSELLELAEGSAAGVLVTVVDKQGSGPAAAGAKMIVYPDGRSSGTVGGGNLESLAIRKALTLIETKENALETFSMDEEKRGTQTGMICGGTATLFFEYFAPQKQVFIFGAGHIGRALAYHLKPLPWRVTIIDDRPEALSQIADADEKILTHFDDALKGRIFPKGAFYVIATYGHRHDGTVLNAIYKANIKPAYVGMVASAKKKALLTEDLKKAEPKADLSVFYIPVGLNIGGTLPQEIAISIIAEMQAVSNGKTSAHLRQLHD